MKTFINETTDDLKELKRRIQSELDKRSKEPEKTVYVTKIYGTIQTFHKKFEDAWKEFKEDVEFTVVECENQYSIEPVKISESEYNLRPDMWFSS